jgi:RNA polymerase sigma-70 factor
MRAIAALDAELRKPSCGCWQVKPCDGLITHIQMGTHAIDRFRIVHARAIAALLSRGRADQWGLEDDALAGALYTSVEAWSRSLAASPADGAVAKYLDELHAEDLVLACACKAGSARAWEHFVTEYRGMLQGAARALVHDDLRARELADSLYAELYGLEERDGVRPSLLAYFHGRSSLRTWLKTVIAQRFVDTYRAGQRAAAISDAAAREQLSSGAPQHADPPEPNRSRHVEALGEAITIAIAELKPRDRMRLNFYYLEELTLKEIGRIMNEYESSVSRRLLRTRTQLRRRIEQVLRREKGLSDEQIRLCYDHALEEWPAALSRVIGSLK